LQRSTDSAPSPASFAGPAAGLPVVQRKVDAVGELVSADAQKPPEQDLDKLTEKVWQRIRRTLQLERERHKGLP
jgi:hypothetical protein